VAAVTRTHRSTDPATPIVILGGGPAGVGVAWYAHRAGLTFDLYERAPTFGGLCRTFRCGDHRYDSGAHRFHDRDAEITRDVRALLGDELLPVSAPSQIYDRGKFIDFPPTPLGLVFSSGIREAGRLGIELLGARTRARAARCETFEDFAVQQFGRSLARRFLLDYSEKLWGLPASELSPDVATRRLQGMTVRSLLTEMLLPARKAEHIDGAFLYPRGGYGRIVERLVETLPPESLHAGHEVAALECDRGRVTRARFADGGAADVAGRLIATLPITRLAALLGEHLAPPARDAAARLRFRHIRLLFLRLAQPQVSRNASIYVPDPALCISRLSEPRNRSPEMAPPGETSLVVEVPCFSGDPVQQLSDDALAARVIDEVAGVGLVERARVIEWRHHFLANAYPVYSLDCAGTVAIVLDALAGIANLETVGRGGRFFYSHLHDQLRFGRDCVARLVAGAAHADAG
jgi:protoporphyrinogen oxidase